MLWRFLMLLWSKGHENSAWMSMIEFSTMKTSKASLAIQRVKEIKNSSNHNMLQQAHTRMFGRQVNHVISWNYYYKKNILKLSIYIRKLSQIKISDVGNLCMPTYLQMKDIGVECNKCYDVSTMLSSEKLLKIWKKPIYWWSQCFPLKFSILPCCKDIKKALLRRSIKGYIEHIASEWSFSRVNIRIVYLRTLRMRTLEWYFDDKQNQDNIDFEMITS